MLFLFTYHKLASKYLAWYTKGVEQHKSGIHWRGSYYK
jgi:hypothetical protein